MRVKQVWYVFALVGLGFWSCKPVEVRAQVFDDQQFRADAYKGIRLTYNMEFEKAQQHFSQLATKYTDHPAPYFLLALNRWWQTYVAANMNTYYHFIESHLDKAISLNENLEDKSAYELEYTFFQYMNYAFKARYYTLQSEWWKAVNAGRKAFPYLKKGFEFKDQSREFYFGSGIYHYYAEDYPDNHPIVKPFMIFFPPGSIEKGIDELEHAAAKPNFARYEAMFYLGDIYLKQLQFKKGLDIYAELHELFPNNTWFQMEYGRALVVNHKQQDATATLRPMIEAFTNIPGHKQENIVTTTSRFTTYLMSRVYLWQGLAMMKTHTTSALTALTQAQQMADLAGLSDDDEYIPAIAYSLGVCHDKLHHRTQAVEQYQYVLDLDQNKPYKDRAKDCIKTPCNSLNIPLLGDN